MLHYFGIGFENLYGLSSLDQIASHESVVENATESPSDTKYNMKEAKQHGPVEGHKGGQHVLHSHVLYPLDLLLQALHGQQLKSETKQIDLFFRECWLFTGCSMDSKFKIFHFDVCSKQATLILS